MGCRTAAPPTPSSRARSSAARRRGVRPAREVHRDGCPLSRRPEEDGGLPPGGRGVRCGGALRRRARHLPGRCLRGARGDVSPGGGSVRAGGRVHRRERGLPAAYREDRHGRRHLRLPTHSHARGVQRRIAARHDPPAVREGRGVRRARRARAAGGAREAPDPGGRPAPQGGQAGRQGGPLGPAAAPGGLCRRPPRDGQRRRRPAGGSSSSSTVGKGTIPFHSPLRAC